MSKLLAYPVYRNSNIEWIGKIPSHWGTTKIRHIFQIKKRIAGKLGFDVISVTQNGLKVKNIETGEGQISMDYSKYQLVDVGDFVMNHMDLLTGWVDRSNFKGVTSPDYRVFSLIDNSYCADYYMRLCQVGYIEKIFYAYGQGVSHFGRWRFTTENFKEFIFPIPPKVEQEAIAKFLEKETNRVTTLIKKKSRFLDLLKEKRQTMVDEAIKHLKTEVLHIQHCCTQVYRSVKRQDDEIYTPIGLYNRGRGIFHKEPTLGRNLGDSDFSYIKEGDLILSGQFSWEGAVALAGNIENDCIASHRYHIFRGKNHLLDTNYFWAYLTTKEGDFLLNENSRGSAGRNRPLNPNTLIKEKIPVPPIEEQLKIAKLVEKERKLKLAVDKSINLLKEHRTALITAAVTGQIDLREYAHDQTK